MTNRKGLWDIPEIRSLSPSRLGDWQIDADDFLEIGGTLDAFWLHQGEPGNQPYHALLKSGLHSNGFLNCSTILAETNLCEILAGQMIRKLKLQPGDMEFVVGPGNAAITWSFEMARQLRARHGFTEKDEKGNPTVFGGRVRVEPHARVLVANELMTTGSGSTYECQQAIRRHQPEVVMFPRASVLVKRSKDETLADGTIVMPLFSYDIANFDPTACPYCAAGSIAIKPKLSQENWAKLTGKAA